VTDRHVPSACRRSRTRDSGGCFRDAPPIPDIETIFECGDFHSFVALARKLDKPACLVIHEQWRFAVKTLGGVISTVLIGSASLALSTHAGASELKIAYAEDGAPMTTVPFSDLDLSKPSDVRALYSRVQEAAAAVCDAEIRAKKVEPSGWRAQCIRTAVAGAGRQVNDEWLAILLRGMPQQARL